MWLPSRRLPIYSWLLFVIATSLLAPPDARGQSVAEMIGYDVKHAAGDVVGTWAAPFQSTPTNWALASSAVGVAAVISPIDATIDNWFLQNRHGPVFQTISIFREGGRLYAGRAIVPLAVALYMAGIVGKNRAIRDGAWGCAASYTAETIVRTELVSRLVGRLRPDSLRREHQQQPSEHGDQYEFYLPSPNAWGTHSLPAGHFANVMSCASFLNHRFHSTYVSVPAYALASLIGIGRLADRRHWTSDTMIGGVFGYAVGKEVGRRSLNRYDKDVQSGIETRLTNGFSIGAARRGVRLRWESQF